MSNEQAQRPTDNNADAWRAYWQAHDQPWRTEPEIDEERQAYLAERRAITPEIEQGIYPFRDENGSIKLTRTDVEWLLATHDGGRGPVVWDQEKDKPEKKRRWGLDLRGADLRQVDLSRLPLARLWGGLMWDEWADATPEQREMAVVWLERARLQGAQLQAARLVEAHLQGAHLAGAWLDYADLMAARMERADLTGAQLPHADLTAAHLDDADLSGAQMTDAGLEGVQLHGTRLARMQLRNADLNEAELQGANLTGAQLQGALLTRVCMDANTTLTDIALDTETHVADVRWNGAPLTRVRWEQAPVLGDESEAWKGVGADSGLSRDEQVYYFRMAVRANHQLATALRAQGLNEHADRYAHRARMLQRQVLWRQRKHGRHLGY